MMSDNQGQDEKDAREQADSPGGEERPRIIIPTPDEVTELGNRAEEDAADVPAGIEQEVDPAALREQARQAEEYFHRLQRLQAEFDNYRKRITRERAELRDWAIRSLVEELVDLLDAFERALHEEHAAEVPEAYRQGIEMVQRKLSETLARYGLSRLEAVGQEFDPHFHEALTHETSDRYPSGMVMDEVKPGYLLGERLLRPSLVRVSSGPGPRGNEEGRE